MAAIALDRIDLLLLAERQRSARRTNAGVAERVHRPASPAQHRVQRRERSFGLGNVRDYGRRGLAPVLAACKARFHVAISLAGGRWARTDAEGGAEEDG